MSLNEAGIMYIYIYIYTHMYIMLHLESWNWKEREYSQANGQQWECQLDSVCFCSFSGPFFKSPDLWCGSLGILSQNHDFPIWMKGTKNKPGYVEVKYRAPGFWPIAISLSNQNLFSYEHSDLEYLRFKNWFPQASCAMAIEALIAGEIVSGIVWFNAYQMPSVWPLEERSHSSQI